MASLFKVLLSLLVGFFEGVLSAPQKGISWAHGGIETMFESALRAYQEWVLKEPLECAKDGCSPELLATAAMTGVFIFCASLCFRSMRYTGAFIASWTAIVAVLAIR